MDIHKKSNVFVTVDIYSSLFYFHLVDMDLPIFNFKLIITYVQRLGIQFGCLELVFAVA
jgi:hypothetical protein